MIIKNAKTREIYSNIGRTIGFAGTAATTAVASIYLVKLIAQMGLDAVKNVYRIDITNAFTNLISVTYALSRYYFGNFYSTQPAAVIGGVPLGSLQEVSHAASHRVLKYRATGGIFLAHQEGGDQTLRLVGKAWGPNRYLFLTMLDMLFMYGSAQMFDMFYKTINQGVADTVANMVPVTNPWMKYSINNIDEGQEEKHLTFPVITKTRIYTNMYIETYEFTESVENGMDCITYSIFFRKYRPPFPYIYSKVKNEEETGPEWIFYYSKNEGDAIVNKYRMIDSMTEIGFSASMIAYRFFQYLAGNSPETTLAHITSIRLNEQVYGEERFGQILEEAYNLDYDLAQMSTQQKAELIGID